MVAPRWTGGHGGRNRPLPGMERPPAGTSRLSVCNDEDRGWRAASVFSETNPQRLKRVTVAEICPFSITGPIRQSMNESAFIPAFYWSRKEHSVILPDVQYATLWLYPTGRFRYINCWPGYAWFSAGGTWYEKDGQLHCQGNSRAWSDGFADNHSNRDYTAIYTRSEDRQRLLPGKNYVSPLIRVSQDTVKLFFYHIDERDLGILRKASTTSLNRDSG